MTWVNIRNMTGDRFIEVKNCSTTVCPPRTANTAENVHDPMNR